GSYASAYERRVYIESTRAVYGRPGQSDAAIFTYGSPSGTESRAHVRLPRRSRVGPREGKGVHTFKGTQAKSNARSPLLAMTGGRYLTPPSSAVLVVLRSDYWPSVSVEAPYSAAAGGSTSTGPKQGMAMSRSSTMFMYG